MGLGKPSPVFFMKKKKSSNHGKPIRRRKPKNPDPFHKSRGMFMSDSHVVDKRDYHFDNGSLYIDRLQWKPRTIE